MQKKKHITWVYVISIIFIITNSFLIFKNNVFLNFLPVFLILALTALLSLERLFLIIVFFTPLSIPLRLFIPGIAYDFYIPTEPLLFGLIILFIFKLIREKTLEKKFLFHPVSIAIYFNIIWIIITSITSTMPLVSFKFLFARLWFVVGFYFFAGMIFQKPSNIEKYFGAYLIPLFIVITYTLFRHSQHGLFNQTAAHSSVLPFFNDHTAYGASLAMMLPVLIGLVISTSKQKLKEIGYLLIIILTIAIIFSYTRATWVSLIGTLCVWGVIKLKIKFKYILISGGAIIFIFFYFQTNIFLKLEKNREESSGNFSKHIQSITNITTDISNIERINRWNCAIRMFKERPIFGHGPGTYMFNYAPYQISYERTPISTNFGDWGNAHSEYLGPLAESGVFGMLSIVLVITLTTISGLRTYTRTGKKEIKIIILSTLIGLFTYFIHGILNNFLDTDKASVLFWGFISILVTLDVYSKKKIQA